VQLRQREQNVIELHVSVKLSLETLPLPFVNHTHVMFTVHLHV